MQEGPVKRSGVSVSGSAFDDMTEEQNFQVALPPPLFQPLLKPPSVPCPLEHTVASTPSSTGLWGGGIPSH